MFCARCHWFGGLRLGWRISQGGRQPARAARCLGLGCPAVLPGDGCWLLGLLDCPVRVSLRACLSGHVCSSCFAMFPSSTVSP